jgi:membrane protein YdbS with pleckstrin-like domain
MVSFHNIDKGLLFFLSVIIIIFNYIIKLTKINELWKYRHHFFFSFKHLIIIWILFLY